MSGGGVEWEQGKAVTRMVQALITNNHEAMALAMSDYAAALGTRTTNILSGIVTTVMLELHEIRLERQVASRAIEHKLDLILLTHEALRSRIADVENAMLIHEALQQRIATIENATLALSIDGTERQLLVDLIRTIPDLTARVQRLEDPLDDLVRTIPDLTARVHRLEGPHSEQQGS